MEDAYRRGKNHAIIVVAEGAKPAVTELAEIIEARDLGFHVRVTILGHIQRGGKPTAFDRMLASRLGYHAVDLLMKGQTSIMVGLNGKEIEGVPLTTVTSEKKSIKLELMQMAKELAQ